MKHFERRIIEFRHTGVQAAGTPWEPTPFEIETDEMGEIVFAEVDSPGAVPPVIDGVMSPGEWDKAKSFALVTGGPTAYIMSDDKFLYVAIDEVSSDGFVAFNVYKSGAYSPERLDSPGVNYDGEPFWDALESSDGEPFDVAVTRVMPSYKFESVIGTITEFKIPLANLGIAAGDAIKVGFVFMEHGVSYVYPADFNATLPLTTYEDFTLAGAAGEILERWYPVLDGSKFDDYLALNGTRLPLMNPHEIALSRGNLVAFGTPVVEAVMKAVPMLEARCPKFKSKVGVEAWAGTGGITAPYQIRLHLYIYRKEELPNIGAIVPGLASITDKARRRAIPVGKDAIALTYDNWDKLPGGLMQSVPKINPFMTWAQNKEDTTPNVDYSFRAILATIDTAKPWRELYFDYEDGTRILIINGLGIRAPANLKDTALIIAGDYHPKTRIPTQQFNNPLHFGHIYPFKPADVPEYVPIPKFDRPYIIYKEIGEVVTRDDGTAVTADTIRVALSGVKIELV